MSDEKEFRVDLKPGQIVRAHAPSGQTTKSYQPRDKSYTRVTASGTWVDPTPEPPPPPPTSGFPPETSPLRYIPPTMPTMPGYLQTITDPATGIKVIRISNGIRHAYSRIPAWNSDGTKLLLGFTPSVARMLHGTTYADIGAFNPVPYAIWANTDPNVIYGASNNSFVRQDARTGAVTVLKTFTHAISIGNYEGGIDDNDRYVALLGGGKLIVFDIPNNRVHAEMALSNPDNAQVSRKGNYVVVVGGTTDVYPIALDATKRQLYNYGRHGDNALDPAGNEIYVTCSPEVRSFRLDTGASALLFPGVGQTAFDAGHVSGRHVTGYTFLSNYDFTFYGSGANKPGKDQIVAVKNDGSGKLMNFGFSYNRVDGNAMYGYAPMAVPSRDGKRVLFASSWGGSTVHAFVASA